MDLLPKKDQASLKFFMLISQNWQRKHPNSEYDKSITESQVEKLNFFHLLFYQFIWFRNWILVFEKCTIKTQIANEITNFSSHGSQFLSQPPFLLTLMFGSPPSFCVAGCCGASVSMLWSTVSSLSFLPSKHLFQLSRASSSRAASLFSTCKSQVFVAVNITVT